MSAPALERLRELENIEKDIADSLLAASKAVEELAKDKPNMRPVLEVHTQTFLKKLEQVESNLSQHINYLTQVSTSQPHEGSSYAAQKDLQMAFHRLEHVRSRLTEMDRWRMDATRYPLQSGASAPGWMDGAAGGLQRSMSQGDVPPRQFMQQDHGPAVQRTYSYNMDQNQ